MEDEKTLAWKVDAAFRQAAYKVIQRAKNAGSLVVIWEEDQIKEVPPEELESRISDQWPKEKKSVPYPNSLYSSDSCLERRLRMNDIPFTEIQSEALRQIKSRVMADFAVVDFVLYGSTARGEADNESDVDIMIVLSEPISRFKRHEITDIVFDANLQFGTNFSTLVVDQESWDTGMMSVLPLRDEIIRDGIHL